MAAEQTSEQVWTWVGTANPSEMIFALYVATDIMTVATSEKPSNKPRRESAIGVTPYVPPTKFKDLDPAFNTAHLCSLGVAEWYFIGESIGPRTSIFYFFKNAAIDGNLEPFDTEQSVGDHYWPTVVLKIWPEVDLSFPLVTNSIEANGSRALVTAPTVHIHAEVIPDTSEGSEIIVRKYLSATHPKINIPKTPQPDSFEVFAGQGSRVFDKVIHDDLVFHATPSGTLKNASGTTSSLGGSIRVQKFPATNFRSRKPYIVRSKPTRNGYGLWEWEETEVIPPKNPKTKRI